MLFSGAFETQIIRQEALLFIKLKHEVLAHVIGHHGVFWWKNVMEVAGKLLVKIKISVKRLLLSRLYACRIEGWFIAILKIYCSLIQCDVANVIFVEEHDDIKLPGYWLLVKFDVTFYFLKKSDTYWG